MRVRVWVVAVVLGLVLCAAVAAAAVLAWPRAHVRTDDAALARISLPNYAGRVMSVEVSSAPSQNLTPCLRW